MGKTRFSKSSKPAAKKPPTTAQTATPICTAPLPDSNPPKIFILPSETSSGARIITLPNPRTSTPTRYYFCPQRGIYEFTKIAAPKKSPRSWLLAPPRIVPASAEGDGGTPLEKDDSSARTPSDTTAETPSSLEPESILSKGYITSSANLFVATPLDPLFLIITALSPAPSSEKSSKQLFLSPDDYFDALTSTSRHYGTILQNPQLRAALVARMDVVCDTVDAGGDRMYRFSEEKLVRELLRKAGEVVDKGLPASLEERFVKKALEVPVVCVKREESFALGRILEQEETLLDVAGMQTPNTDSTADSQTSNTSMDTTSTSASQPSEPALPDAPLSASATVVRLLRLRTVITYLTSTYIPAHLTLSALSSLVDFMPLTAHLTHLASLREEAFASWSLGDYTRKRAIDGDGEDEESRAKKRKKEEEERRKKAGESRGVRDLKKADVRGMKKMSDFFRKKT
jgi:Ydr279p protein family (RNase H2 complex component) wHTH domain/Ydr279p protein triple barrel domain